MGIRVWVAWSAILALRRIGSAAVGHFHAVLSLHDFVGQGVPHQLDRSPKASRSEGAIPMTEDELNLTEGQRDSIEIALAFVVALMLAVVVASPWIA